MFVDSEYLYDLYVELNPALFYGQLPYVMFYPLHAYTMGGVCTVDCDEHGWPYYYVGITDYYDLSELQIRKVLVHELIHVHLYTQIGTEGLRHSEPFMDELWRINTMTGLSVEVMADLDAPKRHNFITAWLKTSEERMFGLPTEAFSDRPALFSKEALRWYS